jgi:phosphatidylinositol 3-kinase
LKLTPYRVLATDVDTGLVQFVETALPLASIFKSYGAIINFFQQFKGDPSAPYGVSPDVMETYIRSCAGYCVMTYLLGVGDRHPDNVLLKPSGHLFHIDFAYILGRDPKPFAPPLRLSQEMVDGMGGFGSLTYKKFLSYCFSAFLILRRSANLFLNLFSLMKDSTLPDILIEPDKVVSKVQERFRLDLSEEEAVHYLQCVISDSLSAFIPLVYDSVHKYLQYMRK